MDLPHRRYFLTLHAPLVTAADSDGNTIRGGCLDTALSFEEMSFTELIAALRQQIIALKQQNIAFILVNGCSALHVARAAVFACRKEALPPVVCMACNADGETPDGDQVTACLIALQALGISAFGVSGALTPAETADVLDLLVPFAKLPLIAAPIAEEQDPLLPDRCDLAPPKMAEAILPLLERGVTILAENDGVTEQHAALLREALFSYDASALRLEREDEEDHIILSNPRNLFVIHDERLELTEPLLCSQDMADELIAAEDESHDVLLIRIETADDAMMFAENAHLAALPVMFSSDDPIALKAALMLYDGRAMIDSESAIEEAELQEIAEKYGSVLY